MNCSLFSRRFLIKCKCRQDNVLINQTIVRHVQIKEKQEKVEDFHASVSDPRSRRLYCWGNAETGALGELKVRGNKRRFTYSHRPIRKKFSVDYKLIDVSCGFGFTLYVTRKQTGISKQIYGSGLNTDSQIGFQTVRGPNYPLKLVYNIVPIRLNLKSPNKTKVLKVAAGRAHSFVLTDKEGIFSLGNNSFGQCGRVIVPEEDYSIFKEPWALNCFDDERIVDIVCGLDHSLFLSESGKVYGCGNGADGQTGLGHFDVTWKPTLLEGDIKNEKIVKLSSVGDTVLAVNDGGDVFGWGNSEYFQLPVNRFVQQVKNPTFLSRLQTLGKIKDVAASGSACMVLTENGELYVWGHGLLGKGVELSYSEEPSLIPLTVFGYSQFRPHVKVTSISCGLTTMAAINNIGDLYMWGKNDRGQLGLGHRNDQFYPMKVSLGGMVEKVSCGVDHTMALCKPFV